MKKTKMKTHKGSKKRFKISGTGKVLFAKQGRRHKLSKKSSSTKCTMRLKGVMKDGDARHIKQMLPYA